MSRGEGSWDLQVAEGGAVPIRSPQKMFLYLLKISSQKQNFCLQSIDTLGLWVCVVHLLIGMCQHQTLSGVEIINWHLVNSISDEIRVLLYIPLSQSHFREGKTKATAWSFNSLNRLDHALLEKLMPVLGHIVFYKHIYKFLSLTNK